jgi:peptidoglycan/xylan/chitin deacetylase (PgdA/CDA1 family)
MAEFLIGYDVECADDSDVTERFIDCAVRLHRRLEVPCTFFIMGKTLELNSEKMRWATAEAGDLLDVQQHTYEHVQLKTICQENDDGVTVFPCGSLERIEEEVSKTNSLLEELLGVECVGITGPMGYYRGLADELDVLALLYDHGIRFTRTYARDHNDWQPVPLDRQPFWYAPQGFPDVLECMIHGWQDCILRAILGWSDHEAYLSQVREDLAEAAAQDLVFSHCQHDWSSIKEDPDMSITEQILLAARELGFRFVHYRGFYEDQLAAQPRH